MSEIITAKDTESQTSLALNNQDFAKIILDFLGNKQELNYYEEFDFTLRLNDLEQYYYKIATKIEKEHHTSIEHFTVIIFYNDGTSREITGIENLNKFHETRDVLPQEVLLNWNIVLHFPNSPTIENQNIRIKFITDISNFSKYKRVKVGAVYTEIEHTNEVWANEILTLIKDKTSEITIKYNNVYSTGLKIKKYLFQKETLPIIFVLLFFPLMIYVSYVKEIPQEYSYEVIASLQDSQVSNNSNLAILAVQNLNSEFLKKYSDNHIESDELKKTFNEIIKDKSKTEFLTSSSGLLIILFSVMLPFLFLYLWVRSTINYYHMGSFIIINNRSEAVHNNFISEKSKLQYISISLTLFTLISGLLVNLIYQLIYNIYL
ncbi:hypothetical protein QCB45_00710 [Thiomicrorhabdus sp. ZW0627]|uniref:hypothetical protein n=1 Tax=Thiomicrorhabdus sp. ZW0627 TaxID=3039774 RepID=UPI0024370C14|nr:hypothetical protein [Thiomicrorhabdus sp. ZW0627]MDG6772847.1 hypothetical protein [Thiomicrorhabdus sp. ZW0627]